MKKLFCFILLIYSCASAFGQNCNIRFSGHVEDEDTREHLSNATVLILELNKTTVTNRDGDFVFDSLCAGTYTLRFTHVQCDTLIQTIAISSSQHRDFGLPHAKGTLGEVVIRSQVPQRISGITDQLSGRQLDETRGQSLAEALNRMAGVTMLQTGSTISKPVIHGLHGNRILLINNGVRQEGQQWGSEHAPEIDPFIAGRLTVLKGASALRFGADAIGGAVLIEPRPLPTTQRTSAEVNTIYFSNNRQYVLNGVLEQNVSALPQLSWRLQATYKRGGNTRTPGYWLHNTGLKELNYSATVGWRGPKYQSELFFSAFNTELGIFSGAHIGNLSDLQEAIKSPVPIQNIDRFSYEIGRPSQDVSHYLLKFRNSFTVGEGNRLNVVLAHQENFRKEFDRALITDRPELDLNIGTTTVDAHIEQRKNITTTLGVFAMRQENVWSGSRFFIPNFLVWNGSVYAIAKKPLSEKLHGEAGIRYDYKTLQTYRNQNNQVSQINRTFNNVSGSVMLDYNLSTYSQLSFNASLAWRAPQVNELYVNGLHHGTANFEIGDPDLQNESAYNFSAQWTHHRDEWWSVDVTAYTNYINGYINLVPSLPPTLTLRGAYPTFRFVQTNALFTGTDITINRSISERLQASAKAALLWARDVSAKDWLQQVPSNRYEGEITYSYREFHPEANYITLNISHVAKQSRIPQNHSDYLPPPGAYTLLNLENGNMFHFLGNRFTLGLSIRNILNTQYREYMNRFRYFNDEQGRNFIIRLKYRL